jgi:hypothetical protein
MNANRIWGNLITILCAAATVKKLVKLCLDVEDVVPHTTAPRHARLNPGLYIRNYVAKLKEGMLRSIHTFQKRENEKQRKLPIKEL